MTKAKLKGTRMSITAGIHQYQVSVSLRECFSRINLQYTVGAQTVLWTRFIYKPTLNKDAYTQCMWWVGYLDP
jgi:hypothetical protein